MDLGVLTAKSQMQDNRGGALKALSVEELRERAYEVYQVKASGLQMLLARCGDEAEWRAECHLAELAATRADEALATAEQCAPQHAEARRADAAAAHQHADATATPPNYPANFAFSPNGCALTYESVQAGATAYPDDENLSDDKVAMYNM